MDEKNLFLAQYGDSEHIDDAIGDDDISVRCMALENPNFGYEHAQKLLDDSDKSILTKLATHPNINKNQLQYLSDKDTQPIIKTIAQYRLNKMNM